MAVTTKTAIFWYATRVVYYEDDGSELLWAMPCLSQRWSPGSIPGQSVCDFCEQSDIGAGFLLQIFQFSLVSTISQRLHTHSLTYYELSIICATGSVVE